MKILSLIVGHRKERIEMPKPHDTYKYVFKKDNKVVHVGITNDLDRREQEHQRTRGWSDGHIRKVGRRTTRDAALLWEREQRRKGKPTGP